jgi:hypothetical protein
MRFMSDVVFVDMNILTADQPHDSEPAFLRVSRMNADRSIPVPAVLSVLQRVSLSEAAPDGA